MHYTYAHIRNDTNTIFYIGKGQGRRAFSDKMRNRWWHHIVNQHGYRAEILAEWTTKEDAYSHERLLIDCLPDLVNLSKGGEGNDGYQHTLECRRHISNKLKNKPKSWQHRIRLSQANIGKTHNRKVGACAPVEWTCPHCAKVGKGLTNKTRWHFDQCKYKDNRLDLNCND